MNPRPPPAPARRRSGGPAAGIPGFGAAGWATWATSATGWVVRAGARGAAAMAAALLVATLAACGPGLGGTGTGADGDPLAAAGAQSVPVCQADFADLLACSAGSGATPQPQAGPRFLAETEPASRDLLELQGQDARLELRCQNLQFSGTWGQQPGQAPRYFGVVRGPQAGQEARATLTVARTAGGVEASLLDAQGGVLRAGVALKPVAAPTTAASCP